MSGRSVPGTVTASDIQKEHVTMLKTRFIKLLTTKWEDGHYLLTAQDEHGSYLDPSAWRSIVFSRHQESFFGTLLETAERDGIDGVVLNGWQLVSLFAKESFNHFIDWDWNGSSEICLAAAHALYDGIDAKEWLPDFSVWEQGDFRWKLPVRVKEEFDASFWEQTVEDRTGSGARPDEASPEERVTSEENSGDDAEADSGTAETALSFIKDLYNHSLDSYLTRNTAMKELFGPKLDLLRENNLSGGELARYFDEEKWLEWVGIKASETPFTIGMRLEEPEDGVGSWSLDVFLRGKKNPDELIGLDGPLKPPAKWRSFMDHVEREEGRLVRLIPWLEDEDHPGRLKPHLTEDEAWIFLTEASETLVALDIEILLPSWWQAMKAANLRVKASVKGTGSHRPSFVGLQAMLDFNWRFSMNGVDLSEDEFNKLVEEKRRLVFVRGRWIKLDPGFIRQIQDLMRRAEKEGLHVRDLLEQELNDAGGTSDDELENPKAFARIQIELNSQWKRMVRQLSEVHEIPMVDVPEELNGELRPYQQLGMSWLWFLREFGFGAVLADDMGLGKTVQLISYLLKVKGDEEITSVTAVPGTDWENEVQTAAITPQLVPGTDGASPDFDDIIDLDTREKVPGSAPRAVRQKTVEKKPLVPGTGAALIICPTSVLGNWQKELERFAPSMKVYLHYGSNRLKEEFFIEKAQEVDVVLTSYGLSHLDSAEFEALQWSTIAIDEAQNIKNAQTKQSKAVRRLRGRHHIALTGTPMENRLTELWSIFDFTNHGYLGSLGQFQKRFVIPIEKDDKKEKVQQLQSLIRPFLLRRTKKDEEVALNLPDKLEQKEYCPLTTEQASLYEQLIHDTFAEIEKLTGFERKGLILQMLSRLKQLCNHPALYLKEKGNARHLLDRSNKLEKLVELVDAVLEQKESCLIFTQYLDMGEMIRTTLKKQFGIEVPFLNGSISKTQRDQMIERFQNEEFPVFLLSLKAGGTGLNLTAANHVIHYDRWWNPAVENQATDRAYRIGQSRFVHVHKLICTGTLEEKIDAMLEKKQFLNDQIIQSENWITELSTDELKDLVYLG
jgi:SNF2 family DNA or RNA helicase